MKPLIRYTIGRVSKTGWDILFESIRLIKKVYPEFDLVVCHNKMNHEEKLILEDINVELVNQDKLEKTFLFIDDDEGKIRNFSWKLMPPRLRIGSHELWVDNDIVIRDRVKGIDKWLEGKTSIIGKGFFPDYGRFVDKMAGKKSYCAGLFGLPPNFDFGKSIVELCENKPLKGFDEQGLVAMVVTSFSDYIVLDSDSLALLSESWMPKGVKWYPNALHFARANRFDNHKCWRAYKMAFTV